MQLANATALILALGISACAHSPRPYSFAVNRSSNELDVIARTLEADGLKPTKIDREAGMVTSPWFDTGYRFREIDDFRELDYETSIFLRYHISLRREGGKDAVLLATDVQRCAPADSYVTPAGVVGSCQPMRTIFPTQQKQVNALGEKLRGALAASEGSSARM
jgi:hypothetical protein